MNNSKQEIWTLGDWYSLTLCIRTNKGLQQSNNIETLFTTLFNYPEIQYNPLEILIYTNESKHTLPAWATIPNEKPFCDEPQHFNLTPHNINNIIKETNQLMQELDTKNCGIFAVIFNLLIADNASIAKRPKITIPENFVPDTINLIWLLNTHMANIGKYTLTQRISDIESHAILEKIKNGITASISIPIGTAIKYQHLSNDFITTTNHTITLIYTNNNYYGVDNNGIICFSNENLQKLLQMCKYDTITKESIIIGVTMTDITPNNISDTFYQAIIDNYPDDVTFDTNSNQPVSNAKLPRLTRDTNVPEIVIDINSESSIYSLRLHVMDNYAQLQKPNEYLHSHIITHANARITAMQPDMQPQQEFAMPTDLLPGLSDTSKNKKNQFEIEF